MKLLLFCALLLTFVPASAVQKREQRSLETNLYYRALVATLEARARDNAGSADTIDPLHQVIIQKDLQLNEGFPTRVGDVAIEYLWAEEMRGRYQMLKREFPIFVMRPITNDGDRLVVAFTRYWFTATKKSDRFALEGGYRVVLRYDCSQNTFVVESAKLWGI